MESELQKLISLINEDGDEIEIKDLEICISKDIVEAMEDEKFYLLPMKNIQNILKNKEFDSETALKIIINMAKNRPDDAILILNSIDCISDVENLLEIAKLLSFFSCCPLCEKLRRAIVEESKLTEKDYESIISKLKGENKDLKAILSKKKKKLM